MRSGTYKTKRALRAVRRRTLLATALSLGLVAALPTAARASAGDGSAATSAATQLARTAPTSAVAAQTNPTSPFSVTHVDLQPPTGHVVAADGFPSPPFNECPAAGRDTSCQFLIVVGAGGGTTILNDPTQPHFDAGDDDAMVGLLNNSGAVLNGLYVDLRRSNLRL